MESNVEYLHLNIKVMMTKYQFESLKCYSLQTPYIKKKSAWHPLSFRTMLSSISSNLIQTLFALNYE
jgi:hypothetical protein